MMGKCHYCSTLLSREIQRKNRLCPKCGSDIHCCKNCAHYSSTEDKCREPESPWLSDRTSANTCPFFEYALYDSNQPAPTADKVNSEAERAKEAFRALFRNP